MPKKLPDIHNFGEYLYYAYANLQEEHPGLVPVLLPVKQVSARLNRYKHIFCRADGYIWIKNIE